MNKFCWIYKFGDFIRYQIIKNELDYIYIKNNEELIKLKKDDIFESNEYSKEQILKISNLINLVHLNQAEILNNVEIRYNNKIIYTRCGEILLAVNPYQYFDIYNENIMKKYFKEELNEPHVYRIAHNAYKQLKNNRKNQSILLSGSSGSSKTYSATLIMK